MKSLFFAVLLTLSTNAFATGLPIRIITDKLDIESVRGVMTYKAISKDCKTIRRVFDGKNKETNETYITFKRSVWSICGVYNFTEGEFYLKLKDQTVIPFIVKKGKLLNNYSRGWGHVIWGAWVDSNCLFRDGEYLSCDAGSDSTYGNKERPFTLYINPTYPMFQWNIAEELR
jgi:hypothetical protein